MARIHRPPPPVPTDHEEMGEMDDNYGVWGENEFDDGEVYENYDNEEETEENVSDDYEEPDAESVPIPQRSVSPAPPPIPMVPPRHGARQAVPVPSPFLAPKTNKVPVGGSVSPRVSPVPTDKRKVVPQPPPVAFTDDDDMYEAIDAPPTSHDSHDPHLEDDGEVYSEVDIEPEPVPQKTMPEKRAIPPIPKTGVVRPSVPIPPNGLQPPDVKLLKTPVSPQMGRREVPTPPPQVNKPAPPAARSARAAVQPIPPPPTPPEILDYDAEEIYEEGDFYEGKEATPAFGAGKQAKPVPRPPQDDDSEDEAQDDEFYTEVPESNRAPPTPRGKADRPIPPIPQPQSSLPMLPPTPAQSFMGSTRIPVDKLKAGLARLAEAKANSSAADEEARQPTEDSGSGSFSANAFLNAKKLLKPVNRGDSMNAPEKPKTVSVKRAESDSNKFTRSGIENKGSLISDMKSKLESKQMMPGKQGVKLPPLIPEAVPEPVSKSPAKSPAPGRKAFQAGGGMKPPPPVAASEVPGRRPLPPKVEADDDIPPSRVPPARNLPSRNQKDNYDSDLKETRSSPVEAVVRPLPRAPGDELGGYEWYFGVTDRDDAKRKVLEIHQDGAFLVRKSERGGDSNPYTLTLLYKDYVYNLHIRKRPDKKFALGSEKPDEHVFNSVEDLVNFHRNNPIEVVGDARKNMGPGKVVLNTSPRK